MKLIITYKYEIDSLGQMIDNKTINFLCNLYKM